MLQAEIKNHLQIKCNFAEDVSNCVFRKFNLRQLSEFRSESIYVFFPMAAQRGFSLSINLHSG